MGTEERNISPHLLSIERYAKQKPYKLGSLPCHSDIVLQAERAKVHCVALVALHPCKEGCEKGIVVCASNTSAQAMWNCRVRLCLKIKPKKNTEEDKSQRQSLERMRAI